MIGNSTKQTVIVVVFTIGAVLAERFVLAKLGITLPQWGYLALAVVIGLLVSVIVRRAGQGRNPQPR